MKRTIIIALSVVALVFGVISYAAAATDDTTVKAAVGTLLEITAPSSITLESAAVDKALIPGVPGSATVTVEGRSNRLAVMSATVGAVGGVGQFTTLTSTTTDTVTGLRGGTISVDYKVEGTVDYNVDPGEVSGTIAYSLVQQ